MLFNDLTSQPAAPFEVKATRIAPQRPYFQAPESSMTGH